MHLGADSSGSTKTWLEPNDDRPQPRLAAPPGASSPIDVGHDIGCWRRCLWPASTFMTGIEQTSLLNLRTLAAPPAPSTGQGPHGASPGRGLAAFHRTELLR